MPQLATRLAALSSPRRLSSQLLKQPLGMHMPAVTVIGADAATPRSHLNQFIINSIAQYRARQL
jgi:hypothetical protein